MRRHKYRMTITSVSVQDSDDKQELDIWDMVGHHHDALDMNSDQ
jgi:hypothetical protein